MNFPEGCRVQGCPLFFEQYQHSTKKFSTQTASTEDVHTVYFILYHHHHHPESRRTEMCPPDQHNQPLLTLSHSLLIANESFSDYLLLLTVAITL